MMLRIKNYEDSSIPENFENSIDQPYKKFQTNTSQVPIPEIPETEN